MLVMGLVMTYTELHSTLTQIPFLNDIKNQRNGYRLKLKNSVKFSIYINLMVKYFSKQVIEVMCLSFSSSLLLTGVIAYFENRDYPLIWLIFWSLLVYPFTFIHICPAVGVAFLLHRILIVFEISVQRNQ